MVNLGLGKLNYDIQFESQHN